MRQIPCGISAATTRAGFVLEPLAGGVLHKVFSPPWRDIHRLLCVRPRTHLLGVAYFVPFTLNSHYLCGIEEWKHLYLTCNPGPLFIFQVQIFEKPILELPNLVLRINKFVDFRNPLQL
jgi:hypothetical protein